MLKFCEEICVNECGQFCNSIGGMVRAPRKPYHGTHGDREMMIIGVGQKGSLVERGEECSEGNRLE